MLTVVAVLKAKEGKEQEVKEAIEALVEKVRTEDGTLAYAAHGAQGTGEVPLLEKYRD